MLRLPDVTAELLSWYEEHKRDLPWRRTTDAWRILVSETMLQQTQVGRVMEKFALFMKRWPNVRSFAAAPLSDVLVAWQGLGYNRRAVFLHRAANVVVKEYKGKMPADPEALLALPGVGKYTTGAVMAFSANANVVLWDTNVRRIVARVFFGGEFARRMPSDAVLEERLAALLPRGRAREWYNALMDFGSLVCTSRKPECETCPLARSCVAAPYFAAGKVPKVRLVKKQTAFEGSFRQVRGAALRTVAAAGGSMGEKALLAALGREEAGRALDALILEGMLRRQGSRISLSLVSL